MGFTVRRVEYYYATLNERPAEAYTVLTGLAQSGVSFVAVTVVPMGADGTQLTLFPEDPLRLADAAKKAGLTLVGPNTALLVQGHDEMGALATIHGTLHDAKVEVFASSGVADGRGYYGYILYVRPEHAERAAQVLQAT
jgi:hypothetical protein